jgi:GTP-binding protein YchF
MLRFGIIGLPQSGKTTVFNALSGTHAAVGDYSTSKGANVAVVKVPDSRVERLAEIFKPEKATHAEIEYTDIAGLTKEASSDRKKEAAYIHSIRQADALLQVVRCFENPNVPHADGSVDAKRDMNEVDSELLLADLIAVENRLSKLEREMKVGGKDADKAEYAMLQRFKESLENEKPLRILELDHEKERAAAGFGFLTRKPMLYILNIGEDQIGDRDSIETGFAHLSETPAAGLASICGSLQADIAELDESERAEFLQGMGLERPAWEIIIKKSFDLLGMISFFTGNEHEVRCWPVKKGIDAHEAAGEIHSDIKRGFIKAEVAAFDDLDRLGSWAKAREAGKLLLHGKDYAVRDGDVILFRFNV